MRLLPVLLFLPLVAFCQTTQKSFVLLPQKNFLSNTEVCHSQNQFMIGWEGVPKKTKSIVLVAQNANSNEEVFWLAYNIDASLDVFEIPKADKDTWQFGRNSTGRTEFNWPCAKKTKVSAQKIKVTAYALSVKTPPFFVPPTKNDVLNAAQGSILEQATFIFQ